MEKIKSFLRYRASGLFLLLLAVFIVFGVSLNSHQVESKNNQSLVNENQISDENQVLGEQDNNLEEITSSPVELNSPPEETAASKEEITFDLNVNTYTNLKSNLKKHCYKSGSDNRKKCKDYCSETKKNSQTKDLYKKYCTEKKNEEKTITSTPAEAVLIMDFIINSGNGTEKFTMEFKEGETVYELMKKAKDQGKLTYEKNTDETYGVYINTINDLEEGSDADWTNNKYWILYVSGKSSSLGCSSHKLSESDTSIEWKYEKYSF